MVQKPSKEDKEREIEREKLRWNQIRSCKDIWSRYNQMTVNPKEDLLLNTESGDTSNDPKLCADQFTKALHTKVERLWSQSGPKSKPSINIDTIPRPILIVPMKLTVYFDQQTHAFAWSKTIKNIKKISKKVPLSSCTQEAHIRLAKKNEKILLVSDWEWLPKSGWHPNAGCSFRILFVMYQTHLNGWL